jgi:ribosomal protein S27E
MVLAVRCPEEKCRKYQLVEDADRGKVVACLICKASIRVPAGGAGSSPPPPAAIPMAKPLPPPNLPRAKPL